MNIIKLILGIIGLIFIGMVFMWIFGMLGTIIWYLFWIGLLTAVGYGGYRLFRKVEDKALGSDPRHGIGSGDIQMSWDEYDRKYLRK